MVMADDPKPKVESCPECGAAKFHNDLSRGELICVTCGVVIQERQIDMGPEWRNFADSQVDRARTGAPMSYRFHDKGLTTQVGTGTRDAAGNQLSPRARRVAYKLRKQQRRGSIHSSVERNLATALNQLNLFISQMQLPPEVNEPCAELYRRVVIAKLVQGRSIEKCLLACLYIACRQSKIVRTLDEFAKVFKITRKELGRYYRLILRKMEIQVAVVSPKVFLTRYCNNLRLPNDLLNDAILIVESLSKSGTIIGKDPNGIAASCIYIAGKMRESHLRDLVVRRKKLNGEDDAVADEIDGQIKYLKTLLRKTTQARLSNVSGVSEVTVRNRYREICNILEINLK